MASYRSTIELHLKPALGRTSLTKLQPQQVSQLYRDLLAGGKSAKTVRNTHGVLHRALEQALRWRLLPVNVAGLVDPPKKQDRDMQTLTPTRQAWSSRLLRAMSSRRCRSWLSRQAFAKAS